MEVNIHHTDIEANNCFSIYHTSWITSGPKSNFICDNIPTRAILFFFGCSEVTGTWLIISELANQRARKVLFTCLVYTNTRNSVNLSFYRPQVRTNIWKFTFKYRSSSVMWEAVALALKKAKTFNKFNKFPKARLISCQSITICSV